MSESLTVGQVARALGVSSEYVRRLCDEKKLPSVRTARGHRMIPARAVLERVNGKRSRTGMVVATRTKTVTVDGERHELKAGVSWVDAQHAVVARHPELFDLRATPAPKRKTTAKARSAPAAPRSRTPVELWFAQPRSVAWDDLTHEQQESIRKTARHESAHTALAVRLNWHVDYVEVHATGGGGAHVIAPKGLSKAEHKRQLALISAMGTLGNGWQPRESARAHNAGDDATIEASARYLGGARWYEVAASIRAEAARIFREPAFQRDVDTLTRALLDSDGKLSGEDVRLLLRRRAA